MTGSLHAEDSEILNWTIDHSFNGGLYQTKATLISSDPDAPASILVIQQNIGDMLINPKEMEVTVAPGSQATGQLTLTNTLSTTQDWQAVTSTNYHTTTSTDPGDFIWDAEATNGERMSDLDNSVDRTVTDIALGFTMPFYGQNYSSINICSNGWLSFTDDSAAYINRSLPSENAPLNLLALFWDDLELRTDSAIYTRQLDSDTFVVHFEDVARFGASNSRITAQARLHSSGTITFSYERVDYAQSATIGIQNGDGTMGKLVSQNEDIIVTGTSITFTPFSNLTEVNPPMGTLAQGEQVEVTVAVNASDLAVGTVIEMVEIIYGERRASVPVTINVVPPLKADPGSINLTVASGASTSRQVNVENIGPSSLSWTASIKQPVFIYDVQNSHNTGSLTYRWLDLDWTPLQSLAGQDDASAGPIELGFEMPFYAQRYQTIGVSSNGLITFGGTDDDHLPRPLP